MDELPDNDTDDSDSDLTNPAKAMRKNDLAALVFTPDTRSNVEEHSKSYHRHRLMQAISDAGYSVGYRQSGDAAVISIGRN